MKVICQAKRILKERNLSVKWLSEQTEIKQGHLYDILANRRNNLYVEYAYKISRALGMIIEEVFEFVEE